MALYGGEVAASAVDWKASVMPYWPGLLFTASRHHQFLLKMLERNHSLIGQGEYCIKAFSKCTFAVVTATRLLPLAYHYTAVAGMSALAQSASRARCGSAVVLVTQVCRHRISKVKASHLQRCQGAGSQ
jgi:hypothetical protein